MYMLQARFFGVQHQFGHSVIIPWKTWSMTWNWRLVVNVSYSTWLFDVLKSKHKDWSIVKLHYPFNIILALLPLWLDELSTYNIHTSTCRLSFPSNFDTKFARYWDLMGRLGSYFMSNSNNSIDHAIIPPAHSVLTDFVTLKIWHKPLGCVD